MHRVGGVRSLGRFLGLALAFGLWCVTSANVVACSSEDSTDTGVSRSNEDDEADRADDNGDRGDDAEESFTFADYLRVMCEYYTRCSSAIRDLYGDKEQCLDYYVSLIDAPEIESQEWSATWNTPCVRNVASLDCPSTPVRDREPIEVYQSFYRKISSCIDTEGFACQDDESCSAGQCSARQGECGICEPLPEGQCRFTFDCATGEACLDGACAPPRATGSECELAEQCASGHCTGSACVDAVPEGGACETTLDCGSYLWCHGGECARPGVAGAACEVGVPLSCQVGLGCHAGTCQPVSYADVPIGGLCASTASCVAGAQCSIESICEATQDECVTDSHCPEGQYCDATCLPKLELGAACDRHTACKSTYCSDAEVCEEREVCL